MTSHTTQSNPVGRPARRREDPRFIQGQAEYVDNLKLPGALHAAILRSPHAHARIRAIDTAKAEAMAGVHAVFAGRQIRDRLQQPLPTEPRIGEVKQPAYWPLAVDKVCHVGEGVALVVADDPYIAHDALDVIHVDYEPLPAVVDTEAALTSDAPTIHAVAPDNVAYTLKVAGGDIDDAFERADVVIEARYSNQRVAAVALEARSVAAEYHPGTSRLTLWTSTQIPHRVRSYVAAMLGMSENRLRVIASDVGGAFGSKQAVYAEEVLIAVAAMTLGRPVCWTASRSEDLAATTHGRSQIQYVTLAATHDGSMLGIRLRIVADLGAYPHLLTPNVPAATAFMSVGCYSFEAAATDITGVFTNTTPISTYRGAGRPEATYLLERAVDMLARELDMDPAELRRRNFIPADNFPYFTPIAVIYDSGDYEAALDKALAIVDYPALRTEQVRRRAHGGKLLGIGLSTYVEMAGFGPSSAWYGSWEHATVRVEPSGVVTVLTGLMPHGQGTETAITQIVAARLGVPVDNVTVMYGDTSAVPYGGGTAGSRGIAVGGGAVSLALDAVEEKACQIAAALLEAIADDVVLQHGKLYVRGLPDRALSLIEVAQAAYRANLLPPEIPPGLEATRAFDPDNFVFPFGAHVCVVEVDPATGQVEIVRYVAVDDCGTVINPMLVDGQVHGGVAQGIGQALYEAVSYSDAGQLLSGTLLDYAVPRATMLPRFETARTVTPTYLNPLGAKGVGEAGTIAATPAVVNAVVDALAHLGVRDLQMPLTSERVWEAIVAGG
ncbi:MAG: xanthine dehydrogenase family protein molybdopterin-binding subunit [Anaerolineae bacterium]